MVYYLNKEKIDVKSLGTVVFKAIEYLTKNGKTLENFKDDLELDFDNKLPLLKPISDYQKLSGRDIDRYSKEFITDVNDKKFYVSTQWGKTGNLENKWSDFIGYCSNNNLEILDEREFEILNKLTNIVNEINTNKEILTIPKAQNKTKSNISIKRIDNKLPPLWIQINTQDLRVGNNIELSYIFKKNNLIEVQFKGNAKQQAYKCECPDEKIKSIIYDYADAGLQKIKEIKEIKKEAMNIPKNQILYGSPGTGKTYSTVSLALDILGASDRKNDITSIGKLKEEFDSQVEFITFHQSFSYEDFVEGLKANSSGEKITYNIEDGIFKKICENAQNNINSSNASDNIQINILSLLNDFANYIENENTQNKQVLLAKKSDGFWGDTYFGNILRKTDGSFKSFQTTGSVANQNLTEKIIIRDYQQFYNGEIKGYKDIKPMHKSKANYHGNAIYYYQLFQRIKEYQNGDLEQVQDYIIKDNIKKPHILIIDEINRGNISQIFGELITLLEETKRAGQKEAITLQLPYSKESFSVPDNLYIIGTMNTADRSLTMMDTALRRRFDFMEMLPNTDLVNGNFNGIDVKEILLKINERIEILYDREHLIGHSFLIKVENLKQLKNAFKNKILPLLEEYFYDDFEKINLVLGSDNFYKKQEPNLFKDEQYNKAIYKKQNIEELSAQAFIDIYAE
jgi:5-methylcytosine-specific restriction protein B